MQVRFSFDVEGFWAQCSGHFRVELMKEVGKGRRKEALKQRRSQRRNWQDITIHRDVGGGGGLLGQAHIVFDQI